MHNICSLLNLPQLTCLSVLGPASEIWGRSIIYNVCNILATVMTVGCAVSDSIGMLLAFRFLTGCFGAVPLAVGGGTIADIARPEQRAKFVAIFSIGPILGPMLGPVIGGFLSERAGWRWCVWLMVILVSRSIVHKIESLVWLLTLAVRDGLSVHFVLPERNVRSDDTSS